MSISEYQPEASQKAQENALKRKKVFKAIELGKITIEEVIQASKKDKAFYSIKIGKLLDSASVDKKTQVAISDFANIELDRKIGSLHNDKAKNKKAKLIQGLHKDFEPQEGWPWTSKFESY